MYELWDSLSNNLGDTYPAAIDAEYRIGAIVQADGSTGGRSAAETGEMMTTASAMAIRGRNRVCRIIRLPTATIARERS